MKSFADRIVIALVLVSASVTLINCSSTNNINAPPPSPTPTPTPQADAGPVDLCADLCEKQVACDPAIDANGCSATCARDHEAFFGQLRDDSRRQLSACLHDAFCEDFDGEDDLAMCVTQASALAQPTDESTTFCDDYETAAKTCKSTDFDKKGCVAKSKIFTEAALSEAAGCFGGGCGAISSCVSTALKIDDPAKKACVLRMPVYDSKCSACAKVSCCAEDNACNDDATCDQYLSCFSECDGALGCQATCGSKYPTGKTHLDAVLACWLNECPEDC